MIFDFQVFGQPLHRTDRHILSGSVFVDGEPAKRLIVIIERTTIKILAATISDHTTGEWIIYGLPEYPEQSLIALSLDNTGLMNSEIFDYVSQGI